MLDKDINVFFFGVYAFPPDSVIFGVKKKKNLCFLVLVFLQQILCFLVPISGVGQIHKRFSGFMSLTQNQFFSG